MAYGFSLYFLKVSQVVGGEEGRSGELWELPAWSFLVIVYDFLSSEVCFGSNYKVFFPACASVTGLI